MAPDIGAKDMSKHHEEHPDYAAMGIFAGYGEGDPKPHFVASECGNYPCTERFCPYPHGEGWTIDGMPGLYNSEADVLAAFAQWTPPA